MSISMSASELYQPQINRSKDFNFPEDSKILKGLACLPVLGSIITIIAQSSLNKKIEASEIDRARIIKLVEIKNHYKVSTIICGILNIAILATCIALCILNHLLAGVIIGGVCIGINVLGIGLAAYRRHKNEEVIAELREHGIRPGMLMR